MFFLSVEKIFDRNFYDVNIFFFFLNVAFVSPLHLLDLTIVSLLCYQCFNVSVSTVHFRLSLLSWRFLDFN